MNTTPKQIVDLTNVLVHCLAMETTVIKIEQDPTLYRQGLKQKLKAFMVECNKNLDRWTEKGGDQPEQVKGLMGDNLTNFYQIFEMVMNLTPQHINEIQEHLITNYFNTPEYEDKRRFVNFVK